MRVLFVDQFSDLGGAQMVLRDVMSEARERGWESWFAGPGEGDLFAWCRSAGIAAQSLPINSYRNGSKSLSDIAQYPLDMLRSGKLISECVRRNRIDLVYVNGPRILAAAADVKCPLVFHLHSALEKTYARAIARLTLRRTRSLTIAASHFVAEGLRVGTRHTSIRVIYNGVRDFGFVPRPRTSRTRKIAIIGRISPEKGHLDFVRAARLLTERGHDVRFIVVGAALFSDPAFEQKVREAAAGSQVEFRGWSDDVASALHEVDIVAAPCSATECSPRVVPECFSAGTPIVAYSSGGIPELIRHGQTGLLTERRTHESLAETLETLLNNAGLMAKLSMNGRREWDARFRIEKFRRNVADVVEGWCHVKSGQSEAASAIAGEDHLSRVRTPHG